MKTVFINNFNILDYFNRWENTHPLEISEGEYNKIQSMPVDKLWKWNEELNTFELIPNTNSSILRIRRDRECFSYINRSPLWFNTLTKDQQNELTEWYKAWLDVTETLEIPTKPEWLK